MADSAPERRQLEKALEERRAAEIDAAADFRIDSLFADQGVELWINGTTVKIRPGSGDLHVVASSQALDSYGLRN